MLGLLYTILFIIVKYFIIKKKTQDKTGISAFELPADSNSETWHILNPISEFGSPLNHCTQTSVHDTADRTVYI